MKRALNSLFTRLLLALFLTGLCVNLLVIGFSWYFHKKKVRPSIDAHILQYTNYLLQDLGDPPDQKRAELIAQKSEINIAYHGVSGSWSTSKKTPSLDNLRFRLLQDNPKVQVAWNRERQLIVVNLSHGSVSFFSKHKGREARAERLVVLLISLLTMLLAMAYITIRWILNPVKWLTEGVKHISQGDLAYRIQHNRTDEFGELINTFNAMTARISDMLHAKEQLLLAVSHELRSPLTRIRVAHAMLPDNQLKESIGADVLEMEKMIAELLETARLSNDHGQLKLEPVNLVALIQDSVDSFKNQGARIILNMPDYETSLQIDPMRVKTLLNNLLTNAIQHSSQEAGQIAVTLEDNLNEVVVRVKDNGCGINAEDLPYLFEPFYRTDKSRSRETGGYGLGLHLCKTIIEAHQGTIEAKSEVGQGTEFIVRFPKRERLNA